MSKPLEVTCEGWLEQLVSVFGICSAYPTNSSTKRAILWTKGSNLGCLSTEMAISWTSGGNPWYLSTKRANLWTKGSNPGHLSTEQAILWTSGSNLGCLSTEQAILWIRGSWNWLAICGTAIFAEVRVIRSLQREA